MHDDVLRLVYFAFLFSSISRTSGIIALPEEKSVIKPYIEEKKSEATELIVNMEERINGPGLKFLNLKTNKTRVTQ